MKFIRKINRGLILFLVLLAVLMGHLITLEASRTAQRSEINEICRQAIEQLKACIVIPQNLYENTAVSSEKLVQEYIEESCQKFQPFCTEDNTVSGVISYLIQRQKQTGIYFTEFRSSSINKPKYLFSGDTVTVTFSPVLSYKTRAAGLKKESKTTTEESFFSFWLKKEEGKWKLSAFDPQVNQYSDNFYYY